MRALKDCEYSAFISYAHADDAAWYSWVSHFRTELDRGLRNHHLLRGVSLPPLHLSGENGPVSGRLSDALKARVAASFAMVIVVHDNYAQSDWCLKELEYFAEVFGEVAFRDRLYIAALSETAVHGVCGGSAWQRLMPGDDQLWVPFYEPTDRCRPIDVYMAPGLVAQAFRSPFERLRNDLAVKLKAAAGARGAEPAARPVWAPAAPTPVTAGATAEPQAAGETAERQAAAAMHAAPAGPPPAAAPDRRDVLFGFVSPATAPAAAAAVARLRGRGMTAALSTPDAVFDDFAAFASASDLVLAFDDAPLMLGGMSPGGHLGVQRDAWLARGKPAGRLHWLDLRSAPPPDGAGSGAAAWVAGSGAPRLALDALTALLERPRADPPPAMPQRAGGTGAAVRIYIESNRNERTLWEPLGQQIRRAWDAFFRHHEPTRVPPLELRARGLPVEQIDSYPSLDDADGLVLLWGKKTSDALVAQIDKVEKKTIAGRDGPPGIVAYLMPPQQSTEPVPAWGWQVLRFDARDEDRIDVLDDERDALARFLGKVLDWRRRRDAA